MLAWASVLSLEDPTKTLSDSSQRLFDTLLGSLLR